MNRSIIFFILCFITSFSNAQIEKLLKNKDITWVAEVENDFYFNDNETNNFKNNLVNVLKISKGKDYATDNYDFFRYKIAKAIREEKIAIFETKDCKKDANFRSIDTIVAIDPLTFYTSLKVITNDFDFNGINQFRAHQILYYNSKKATWGIQTLAIAPLKLHYWNDTLMTKRPLFWMKIDNKKLKLSSKSVVWAIKTSSSEASNIDFSKVNILKNTLKEMPLTAFIDQAKSNKKFKAYNYHDCKEVLSLSNLTQRIVPEKDTIFPLDPETQLPIMSTPFIAQYDDFDVSKLKIVQDWFWDDKRQRLCVHTRALAPVRKHVYYVDYSVEMPLFYVMPK
jgi:Gliding motility associated protein GldN